ncbi:MAG: hypothetical protein ACP5NS_02440 [Candidatus Pacearchaeota archaeon]
MKKILLSLIGALAIAGCDNKNSAVDYTPQPLQGQESLDSRKTDNYGPTHLVKTEVIQDSRPLFGGFENKNTQTPSSRSTNADAQILYGNDLARDYIFLDGLTSRPTTRKFK